MSSPRLTAALDSGSLVLPEGRIAVFAPVMGAELTALPRERVQIISRFAPDAAYWQGLGYDVRQTPEGTYAAAVVMIPRAKDAAKGLLAEAAAHATLLIVDGQKTDGIDSILKSVKAIATPDAVQSKAHGKIFWLAAPDLSAWTAQPGTVDGDFVTRPGVFSADGPDKGSQALVAALPTLSGHVIDLGAGWGFLSRAILSQPGVTTLDLVEADLTALDCARENVTDPRAQFYWADATRFEPKALADTVVTNPPFHVSRAGDPGLGRAFIDAAADMLKPSGQLILVANRHLPYEDLIATRFREHAEIGGTGPFASGFKVIRAAKPHRARR